MVILGAASPFIGIEYKELQEAIRNIFRSKGDDVIQVNLNALQAGLDVALKQMNQVRV